MNNVLIDDRRIKVDFSQSVAHLWKQFKKWVALGAALGARGQEPEGAACGGLGGMVVGAGRRAACQTIGMP